MLTLLGAPLLFLLSLHAFLFGRPDPASSAWDSGQAVVRSPNSTLRWHVCPDKPVDDPTRFLCSTHKVPLNWLNSSSGREADLFLRLLPSKSKDRLGTLVVNNGGASLASSLACLRADRSLQARGQALTSTFIALDRRSREFLTVASTC